MRVLLISHTCLSATAGLPKAVELARLGVDLCVLVPSRWREYGTWRGPDVLNDPPYRFISGRVMWPWAGLAQWYLHWYPGLAGLLREFKPDIIDLWEEPWGLVSAHACWLRNRILPECRIVSETEQNIDKHLPPPFETYRKYTLRNADFVISRNSEAVEIVHGKGYNGPAEVIPNAVDTSLFRPLDRDECRRKLGFSGFMAGYAGRLVEEKGLMDLAEAVALCGQGVSLALIGDGPYKPALQQRCSELGLGGRVSFLPACPLEELPVFMNAIDVFVLPSRTTSRWKEQFGRVIIEAQACGTSVIGSDSGAIPEVIGDMGLVVPEASPQALAEAISNWAADPASIPPVRPEAVASRYSWQSVAGQYHTVYASLLGQVACEEASA